MPTCQEGTENRDKAYSELRIFEDQVRKAFRDKHDCSYFLELHTLQGFTGLFLIPGAYSWTIFGRETEEL